MLIRHSIAFTAGKLLPGLLGMAATALLTRLLDPAAYGLYGLSLVVMGFGAALLFDWLGVAFLRVATDARDAAGTVAALFAGLVALAAVGAGIAWAAGLFGGGTGPAVAAGLLLMVCYAGSELAARLPVALAQPGRFLLMNGFRAGLSLAGAGSCAWLTHDPVATACGTAVGMVGGMVLGCAPLRRWRFDASLARRLLRFGLPLAGGMALASLAGSGIRSLLDVLGSAEALGVYTAAFLLVQNTLAVVAAGIASAGYPVAVRAMASGDEAAAQRQLAANWSLLLAVLAPMALGMALAAPQIAAALVGPRYVEGVAALTPWLAGAGLLAGLRAHGLDHVFQLAERPGRLAAVTAAGAALAVGMTAGLVPRFGADGAAMAALTAAACSCALAYVWGRRLWVVPLPAMAVLRIGAACLVMAGAVWAAPAKLMPQIGAGMLGYGVACVALNVLDSRRHIDRLRRCAWVPRPLGLALGDRPGVRLPRAAARTIAPAASPETAARSR